MMRIPEPSEGGSKETESGKDITMAKPDERHNELLKIKFSSSGDGGSGRGGLAVPFRPWELEAQWALRCTWRNTVYTGAESLSKWWWGGAHTVEIRVHQLKGDTPQVDVPSSTGNSSPDVIWLLILDAPRSAKKIFEYDFYLGEKQKPIKGITSPKKEAYQEEKKKKSPSLPGAKNSKHSSDSEGPGLSGLEMTHSRRISVLPGKSWQRSLYYLLDMEEEACSPRNCWWPAWAHLGNQSKGSTENGKKRCPWWHHWVPGFILTWTYIWTFLLTVPADFLHSLSQFNFLLFFLFFGHLQPKDL